MAHTMACPLQVLIEGQQLLELARAVYVFPGGGFVYDLYSFAGNIFSVITPRVSLLSHGELVFGATLGSPVLTIPPSFSCGRRALATLAVAISTSKFWRVVILPYDTALTIER